MSSLPAVNPGKPRLPGFLVSGERLSSRGHAAHGPQFDDTPGMRWQSIAR
ncbi:MAG: hypothetical protein ACT6SF_10755 [Hydrogenophaga sp.]